MKRFGYCSWRILIVVTFIFLAGGTSPGKNIDMRLHLVLNDETLIGEVFIFEVIIVNEGAETAWNEMVNSLDEDENIGKKEKEFAKRLPVIKLAKWDENVQIRIMKISKVKGQKLRKEVVKGLHWPKYYMYPDEHSETEIRWISGNAVRRTWALPASMVETLGSGEYEIIAVYNSRSYGNLESEPKRFIIRRPTTSKEKARICDAQAARLIMKIDDKKPIEPQVKKQLEDEAICLYKKALELDPDHYGAHAGLAGVYYCRGNLEPALEQFELYYKKYVAHKYGNAPIPIDKDGHLSFIKHYYIDAIKEKIAQQEKK